MERCYASDTPCAPSRAALTSGQFGITTGAIANFGPASEIRMFDRTRYAPSFGGHLYRNGIYAASIACFPERHMAYWFLQVHFWDPHTPYLEPGDWARRASESGPAPAWPDEEAIAAHFEIYGPHSALDLYEGDGTWSVPPPPSPNA